MRVYSVIACAALGIFGLTGCASVPKGSAQLDGALKSFMPKPGVAGIYVYRKDGIGGMTKMDVAVDGKSIGQLTDKTYLYVEVAPGKHVVSGQTGKNSIGGIEINALPAKLYYVKQVSKDGWFSFGSTLVQVDVIEAQHDIKRTSLAAGAPASAP